jgi:DNA-directed RNA polymerase specialized sigma24 family protein
VASKEVFELKINGFTHEEICESLGKSFKSIEGVLYRIRIKIREILNEIN